YTRTFFLSHLRAITHTSSVDIRIDSSSCDFHNSSWDCSRSFPCIDRSFDRLPVQQLFNTVNLGRDVGRRKSRDFCDRRRLFALQVKQNDLPVERLKTMDTVEQPRNRKLLIGLDLAIHESGLCLQSV